MEKIQIIINEADFDADFLRGYGKLTLGELDWTSRNQVAIIIF